MTELDVCDQHYVGFSADSNCAICRMYYSLEVVASLLAKIATWSFVPRRMRTEAEAILKDITESLACIRDARGEEQ